MSSARWLALVAGAGFIACASVPRPVERSAIEAAVKGAPEGASGWRDLGWADFLDGDREAAARDFAKAIALDPSDARALFGLATLADEGGRFAEERDLLVKI